MRHCEGYVQVPFGGYEKPAVPTATADVTARSGGHTVGINLLIDGECMPRI